MGEQRTAGARAHLDRGRRADVNGWVYVRVAGKPYDRGYQHGYLLAAELRRALHSIRYLVEQDTGVPFDCFAGNAQVMYEDMLRGNFGGKLEDGSGAEVLEELEGIVAGAAARRKSGEAEVTLTDLLGWNAYPEMICQWWPAVLSGQVKPPQPLKAAPHPALAHLYVPRWHHFHHSCSAFVAAGKWTADGEIVAAQTTWQRFANGDAYNVILDLEPESGSRLVMQSVPGYVHSSTDFWVTGAGLVVAESSLSTAGFDPQGLPEFFRARRAGQYADSIRSWRDLFREGNNGGYVNTWLLADVRRGEIAAYELTLGHDELQPVKRSGYYASCNIPLSLAVRTRDCPPPSGYDNILMNGARRVRFDQLMAQHRGRIDAEVAQAILADHHDVYLNAEFPSSRTVCGHLDNDDARFGGSGNGPYYPWGSLDGKVTTGALARDLKLLGRWGRACGTPLNVDQFHRDHPQYDWLRGHMQDRPTRPWTEFPPG